MADSRRPDPNPDVDGPDEVGTPRWVKVFGILFILVVAVIIIVHLSGRGFGGHP